MWQAWLWWDSATSQYVPAAATAAGETDSALPAAESLVGDNDSGQPAETPTWDSAKAISGIQPVLEQQPPPQLAQQQQPTLEQILPAAAAPVARHRATIGSAPQISQRRKQARVPTPPSSPCLFVPSYLHYLAGRLTFSPIIPAVSVCWTDCVSVLAAMFRFL